MNFIIYYHIIHQKINYNNKNVVNNVNINMNCNNNKCGEQRNTSDKEENDNSDIAVIEPPSKNI